MHEETGPGLDRPGAGQRHDAGRLGGGGSDHGNGNDDRGAAPVAGGGTLAPAATLVAGPIAGFGSVIVNGVRFSSVGAELVDDDGLAVNLAQLKLGMTVRVSGEADEATQQGTARQVELVHGTRGLLTAVNVAAGTLTLLGQTVSTNSATAYQGAAGLAGLTVGQPLEVYGVLQADGSLLATLIEVRTALSTVSLSGLVSQLTATSFRVGDLTVNYSPAVVSGVLGAGQRVKIKAASGPVNHVLTASAVRVLGADSVYGSSVTAGARLKLKGVAEAAPVNGVLNVSGTPVNVSKALVRGGAAIAAGQFVEVTGQWDGGVLQATEVELDGYRESQIGGRNELYGAIGSVSGSTVVVDGVTVELGALLKDGRLAQVPAVGRYVEIKGNLVGSTLQATRVEFKNASTGVGASFEQYGQISGWVSAASFRLNGLQVDASGARFEHGSAASLGNGVYVEIKGAQNASGVFVASKVEVKNGFHD